MYFTHMTLSHWHTLDSGRRLTNTDRIVSLLLALHATVRHIRKTSATVLSEFDPWQAGLALIRSVPSGTPAPVQAEKGGRA